MDTTYAIGLLIILFILGMIFLVEFIFTDHEITAGIASIGDKMFARGDTLSMINETRLRGRAMGDSLIWFHLTKNQASVMKIGDIIITPKNETLTIKDITTKGDNTFVFTDEAMEKASGIFTVRRYQV